MSCICATSTENNPVMKFPSYKYCKWLAQEIWAQEYVVLGLHREVSPDPAQRIENDDFQQLNLKLGLSKRFICFLISQALKSQLNYMSSELSVAVLTTRKDLFHSWRRRACGVCGPRKYQHIALSNSHIDQVSFINSPTSLRLYQVIDVLSISIVDVSLKDPSSKMRCRVNAQIVRLSRHKEKNNGRDVLSYSIRCPIPINFDQLRSVRMLGWHGSEIGFQDRLNLWQAGQDIERCRVLKN